MPRSPSRRLTSVSPGAAPRAPITPGPCASSPVGPNQTQIYLRLDYLPEGIVEKTGDALGLVERRVTGDLERFKKFIESRGGETGAWRGEIHNAQVQHARLIFAAGLETDCRSA